MSRNSSLLQCIAELLQGASIKISIAETINSVIAAAIVEDCSRSIRYKQAYSQNKEVIKQENTVGISSILAIILELTLPCFLKGSSRV